MKEKNYDRLRAALDRLPEYDPPARSWPEIERGLEREGESVREPLSSRLPTYVPPTTVWNAVNEGLDAQKRVVRRRLPRRLLAAAAAVALLLFAAVGISRWTSGPRVTYAYSQESQPDPVTSDWDDDEASFQRARAEVRQRDEPILNNLGHELDELNSAREEVKAMLVAYGESPAVIQQLAEIERERDDVYRRIIVEL